MVLVCTLGAKLLYDRATRPHVWIQVATYDPELPIRGRYLAFNLQVPMEGFTARETLRRTRARFLRIAAI